MNKYMIEFEAGNLLGSELIFAESKVNAIKTFLKGQKNKLVIIKKAYYYGHI